jgi:hypothetical protein
MMAAAITCTPTGPRMALAAAVPTRSCGGGLNLVEGQHEQIGAVGEQVEKGDEADAEQQRERDVALRVAGFRRP